MKSSSLASNVLFSTTFSYLMESGALPGASGPAESFAKLIITLYMTVIRFHIFHTVVSPSFIGMKTRIFFARDKMQACFSLYVCLVPSFSPIFRNERYYVHVPFITAINFIKKDKFFKFSSITLLWNWDFGTPI